MCDTTTKNNSRYLATVARWLRAAKIDRNSEYWMVLRALLLPLVRLYSDEPAKIIENVYKAADRADPDYKIRLLVLAAVIKLETRGQQI